MGAGTTPQELTISSSSDWEEGSEASPSRTSSECPPPVIFAGISSPGRFKVRRYEKSIRKSAAHTGHDTKRRNGVERTSRTTSSIIEHQRSTIDVDTSPPSECSSSVPVDMRRASNAAPDAKQSEPLMLRAEIERRSKQGADLKNQVAELEAALDHSRARESVLSESLAKLQVELNAKEATLSEKHTTLTTLEDEHRQLKSNFRDLMENSLEFSAAASTDVDMGEGQSSSGARLDLTPQPSTSQKPPRSNGMTSKSPVTVSSFEATQGQSSSTRRVRSAPPGSPDRAASDLKWRLRQTEELLETLRGTNGYAQQVLKRNSELERRCDELETSRDGQLREVFEAFQESRAEASELRAVNEKLTSETAALRQDVANLHAELQRGHEKARRQKDNTLELTEAKAGLADARDALGQESAARKREAAEWAAERDHLIREVTFLKRLAESKGPEQREDRQLEKQLAELEGILVKARGDAAAAAQEFQAEITLLRARLHQTQSKLDAELHKTEDRAAQVTELQQRNAMLEESLQSANKRLNSAREKITELTKQANDADQIATQLRLEKEKTASQAERIARHLESISAANQRFSELVERNSVLDKLLQKQQKEKEKIVAEGLRSHEQLYTQADSYRRKWELATVEIGHLKKQLAEQDELRRLNVEAVELAKTREVRQCQDEFVTQRLAIQKAAEAEISNLRQRHADELSQLRGLRDKKMESVTEKYEVYIQDVKNAYEKKIQDLLTVRDREAASLKSEVQRSVATVQASWKERMAKERTIHEEEMRALTKAYKDDLQDRLNQKDEEVKEWKRMAETEKANCSRTVAETAQKLEQHQMQARQMTERVRKEADDNLAITLEAEKAKHQGALAAAEAQRSKELKDLQEKYAANQLDAQRQLAILNEKLIGANKEIERLLFALKEREAHLAEIKESNTKAAEAAEAERRGLIVALQADLEATRKQLEQRKLSPDGDKSEASDPETTERLHDRLSVLLATNAELEQRLQSERDLLKGQLAAKEERLNALLIASRHTEAILKRNSQLEESIIKKEGELATALQGERDRRAAAESELSQQQSHCSTLEAKVDQLSQELQSKIESERRLSGRIAQLTDRLERQVVGDSEVKSLEAAIEDLRRRLKVAEQQRTGMPETVERLRQTLKKTTEEFDKAKEKNKQNEEEMKKMRASVEESSKLMLEVQLLNSRLQSQDETFDLLRTRAEKKQELIDDLKSQLHALMQESGERPPSSGTDERLREVAERCQALTDLQQSFEQEKRSLERRTELDRQLLTQAIDQKDRQLQQLLETNKRAEVLFARNAELEEMLLKLTNDLEAERLSATTASAVKVQSPDRSEAMTKEIEELHSRLMQKERTITTLQGRLNDLKGRYADEVADITNRLRLNSLQQSLPVPSFKDDDTLQRLVEKTTELQQEVVRLRRERDGVRQERDERILQLEAENEALRSAKRATPRSANERDLVTQIETLEVERTFFLRRIAELVEALKSASAVDDREIEDLRQRNVQLQNAVDNLRRVVDEQEKALSSVDRHANEALHHNEILRRLSEKMHFNLDDDEILEKIIRRNLELEELLGQLQLQKEMTENEVRVSRRSTTATTSFEAPTEAETDAMFSTLQDKIAKVQADVQKIGKVPDETSLRRYSDPSTISKGPEDSLRTTVGSSTPSTSVGHSRYSPPSPSLSGRETFTLAGGVEIDANKSDPTCRRFRFSTAGSSEGPPARISMYEVHNEVETRRKRPRTSGDAQPQAECSS